MEDVGLLVTEYFFALDLNSAILCIFFKGISELGVFQSRLTVLSALSSAFFTDTSCAFSSGRTLPRVACPAPL